MQTLIRGLIALVGLFNMAVGVGFLLDPERLGTTFFLSPAGIQGLATMRADFPGFFITAAVFAFAGAWRVRAAPLVVPIVMLSVALAGRLVSLVLDGVAPTAPQPMVIEVLMIAVLYAGYRTFDQKGGAHG